jgi:hypothetical protein
MSATLTCGRVARRTVTTPASGRSSTQYSEGRGTSAPGASTGTSGVRSPVRAPQPLRVSAASHRASAVRPRRACCSISRSVGTTGPRVHAEAATAQGLRLHRGLLAAGLVAGGLPAGAVVEEGREVIDGLGGGRRWGREGLGGQRFEGICEAMALVGGQRPQAPARAQGGHDGAQGLRGCNGRGRRCRGRRRAGRRGRGRRIRPRRRPPGRLPQR